MSRPMVGPRLQRVLALVPWILAHPGVTIGERSVVAPMSLVNSDVPDGVIVGGCPAKVIMTVDAGLGKNRKHIARYLEIDRATKYPWKMDRDLADLTNYRNNT